MTEDQIRDRALTMAALAPDDAMTASTLVGRSGQFSSERPLTEPPLTYLEPTEGPAFILANTTRGIRIGSERRSVSPSELSETLVVVTGRRTLCLVGQSNDDELVEIPHTSVVEASYTTGFRAYRLTVQTPKDAVHCWVNPNTAVDRIAAATSFINERAPASPEPLSDDTSESYRGQPLEQVVSQEDG